MKLATVKEVSANGTKIKFDGENLVSEQYYSRLDSYTPANEDRVLLAQIAGTHVILGKVTK